MNLEQNQIELPDPTLLDSLENAIRNLKEGLQIHEVVDILLQTLNSIQTPEAEIPLFETDSTQDPESIYNFQQILRELSLLISRADIEQIAIECMLHSNQLVHIEPGTEMKSYFELRKSKENQPALRENILGQLRVIASSYNPELKLEIPLGDKTFEFTISELLDGLEAKNGTIHEPEELRAISTAIRQLSISHLPLAE